MSDTVEPIAGQVNRRVVPENLRGVNGRPPKVNAVIRQEIYNAYKQFIIDSDDPNVASFITSDELCLKHEISDDNIYDWQEFSGLRKMAIKKQEAYLLKHAGSGKYNPTLAIFRLKQPQHGYKDRIDTDITSGGDRLGVGLSAEQADQLVRARANRTNIS